MIDFFPEFAILFGSLSLLSSRFLSLFCAARLCVTMGRAKSERMSSRKADKTVAPTPKQEDDGGVIWLLARVLILIYGLHKAYDLRMGAINTYGPIIHEFDPWYNYRATEYLNDNGWEAFFKWYDYMSWYPLGRPVGTTIYPGMQIIAVAIYRALGGAMSLNDVCAYIPVWGGVLASAFFVGSLPTSVLFRLRLVLLPLL